MKIKAKKKLNRKLKKKSADLLTVTNNYHEKKINTEIKIENINDLPYFQAIKVDKRNAFAIFKSVLLEKIELIDIFLGDHKIVILLIFQYILSLLLDLFLNAFLYTDEVVSNKYHNNGQLDIIVSLTITLLSNIINSIICSTLNFSKDVEERLEQII